MVKFITYKKQELPVRLSYRALKTLKGKDLAKLATGAQGAELDGDLFEDLLFAGLQSGHKAEDKEFTMKKEEMEDVLDECFFEFVKLIPLFFAKSKPQEVGKEEPNPELSLNKETSQKEIGTEV